MDQIGTKTIETERLILRRYVVEDAEDMYQNWAGDPEVTKFLSWPTHPNAEFSRKLLEKWVSYYDEGRTYNWGITLKGEDHVIGNIAVVERDELGQSAGLKETGHQEGIAGCIYLMGKILGIVYVRRYLISVFPVEVLKHIFITILACSQHYYLYRILAELVHDICYKIKSFLIRKP